MQTLDRSEWNWIEYYKSIFVCLLKICCYSITEKEKDNINRIEKMLTDIDKTFYNKSNKIRKDKLFEWFQHFAYNLNCDKKVGTPF